MTDTYTIECPYCRSIRYNTFGQDGIEEHLFCRVCDKEFVVNKEKENKIVVKMCFDGNESV